MQAHAGSLKTRKPFARRMGKGPVAIALVAAMLVGGTYLWQHAQVNERQVALDRALSTGDTASSRASALESQIGDLQGRIEALRRRTDALSGRLQDVSKGKQHVAALLRESEHRLNLAEARMSALLGSPLADGKYFGELVLVGVTQDPPRLVIDLEQWFSGAAADQAAKEDGVLPPGEEHVPNDVYIRNESPQWRILSIDPATKVSLTTYPFGQVDAPLVVTLGRFGKVFSADKAYIAEFPYWITVRDGKVVAIAEQYMP